MRVTFVHQRHCPMCSAFKQSGVADLVKRTIHAVPDVHWVPKRIEPVGRSTLHTEDGRIVPKRLYDTTTRHVEELAGEIYTPQVVLEAGDTVEEFHAFEPNFDLDKVDQTTVTSQTHDQPKSVARAVMRRVFRFYLQNVVNTHSENALVMRQLNSPSNPQRLMPDWEWDHEANDAIYRIVGETVYQNGHQIEKLGWKDAFIRANEAEY